MEGAGEVKIQICAILKTTPVERQWEGAQLARETPCVRFGQWPMSRKRFVFLLSAPSGTGKTTVIRALLDKFPDLHKIVTTTSRPPRVGETPGVDYMFVSPEEFDGRIEKGELIEWKEHFGHRYGLTWSEFHRFPDRDAIFDMDVFGKDEFLSKVDANCITIFLAPPSIEAMEQRIRSRGEYSDHELRERVGRALQEMELAESYDIVVVNHQVQDTVREVAAIVQRARNQASKAGPRYVCVEGLIGSGKTTLTQILGASLGAKLHLDPYDHNPFLRDFYLSKRSYALETELSFALLRYRSVQRIGRDLMANRLVVSDFTMWRSHVFAAVNLDHKAQGLFRGIYDVLARDIPTPDLLIWIEAPYDLLLRRIRTRGRPEEILGVGEGYLRDLESRYREILHTKPNVEIVTVSAESLDLVSGNAALSSLASKIVPSGSSAP